MQKLSAFQAVVSFLIILPAWHGSECFGALDDDPGEVIAADPNDLDADGQSSLQTSYPWQFRFPEIVRFRSLPHRMMNEPFLEEPVPDVQLPEGFQAFCEQCFLKASDFEIRTVALKQLSRLARLDKGTFSHLTVPVTEELKAEEQREMFWACLNLIRDADLKEAAGTLTELSRTSSDDVLRMIDPLLAEWQHSDAALVWADRLSDPSATPTGLVLACEGLVSLGKSEVTGIGTLVTDPRATYQLQTVAAKSCCALTPTEARQLAGKLVSGSTRQKLLAGHLLNQQHPDAVKLLLPLCEDKVDGVARLAWETLERQDPEKLLPLLKDGVQNKEAGIRQCCLRVVQRFATEERILLVIDLIADAHIAVRNTCRASLTAISTQQPEFTELIVTKLGDAFRKPDATWERLEQTCYTLAALKRPEFADRALELCEHDRTEVFVSAAWLLHLMPDSSLNKRLAEVVRNRIALLKEYRPELQPDDIDWQIAFLFQAGGYSRCSPLQSLMNKQFSKNSGLYEFGRTAGVWAAAALMEGTQDKAIAGRLLARLNDREDPLNPEYDNVRRIAAQGLGRVAFEGGIDSLVNAFESDLPDTYIPQSARWSLMQMGQPSLGPLSVPPKRIGSWRLLPVSRQQTP